MDAPGATTILLILEIFCLLNNYSRRGACLRSGSWCGPFRYFLNETLCDTS